MWVFRTVGVVWILLFGVAGCDGSGPVAPVLPDEMPQEVEGPSQANVDAQDVLTLIHAVEQALTDARREASSFFALLREQSEVRDEEAGRDFHPPRRRVSNDLDLKDAHRRVQAAASRAIVLAEKGRDLQKQWLAGTGSLGSMCQFFEVGSLAELQGCSAEAGEIASLVAMLDCDENCWWDGAIASGATIAAGAAIGGAVVACKGTGGAGCPWAAGEAAGVSIVAVASVGKFINNCVSGSLGEACLFMLDALEFLDDLQEDLPMLWPHISVPGQDAIEAILGFCADGGEGGGVW